MHQARTGALKPMSKKTISLHAPAKINLFLEVLGRRPDGYHELETVMQEVNLTDVLTLEETTGGIKLTCTNSDIPSNENNLVWKAACALQKEVGVEKGVRIHLEKRIPVAAGLGGGSSDAAATLKGLNTLWGTGLGEKRLMEIATQIGSDVPFFIRGGTALCTGRGEMVTPLPVRHKFYYIILYPEIMVSTAEIYNNLKIGLTMGKKDASLICKALLSDNSSILDCMLFNRLEEVAFELYPQLKGFKELLEGYISGRVLLSGSGSAIYGRCKRYNEAKDIKEELNRRGIKKAFIVSSILATASA